MAQYTGTEWCFTINARNETKSAECFLQLKPFYDHLKTLPGVTYLAVKGERGENGNYHLQGFVIFATTFTRNQLKGLIGCSWMWAEKRSKDSTPSLAAAYVKKTETSWAAFPLIERGSLPMKDLTVPAEKKAPKKESKELKIFQKHMDDLEDMCDERGIDHRSREERFAALEDALICEWNKVSKDWEQSNGGLMRRKAM